MYQSDSKDTNQHIARSYVAVMSWSQKSLYAAIYNNILVKVLTKRGKGTDLVSKSDGYGGKKYRYRALNSKHPGVNFLVVHSAHACRLSCCQDNKRVIG